MKADEGVTVRAWLHLAREGGRWSAAELGKCIGRDSGATLQLLKSMSRSSHVRKYDLPNRRVEFGITAACKVPRDVTLAELGQSGAIRVQQETT
jgi:hypothetical protein